MTLRPPPAILQRCGRRTRAPYGEPQRSEDVPEQTVPPLPLLWWGVRGTLPYKPQPSEKPRCEIEKVAQRVWPVRTWYMGTCVSPLQSAESPKDVNKVMARFGHKRV